MIDRKEYIRKWQRECLSKRRAEWFATNGPCKNCGSDKDLEVHHVNPLEKETHRVWSWSQERRDKELAKCIVLCKECHKEETKKQFSKIQHGTKNTYSTHKCRCNDCKEFMKIYWKRRDRTKTSRDLYNQTVKYK